MTTTINDIEEQIGIAFNSPQKGRGNKTARIADLCRELKGFGISGFKAKYLRELARGADKTATSKTIKALMRQLPHYLQPAQITFYLDSPNSQAVAAGAINFKLG